MSTIPQVLHNVLSNSALRDRLSDLFLEDWYVGTALNQRWLVFQNPYGWNARVFDVELCAFVDDADDDGDFSRFTVEEDGRLFDAKISRYYPITAARSAA